MNNEQKKRKAVFFSFEGIDGSGKSVQAEALYKQLKDLGHTTTLFREPGGTHISEQIRDVLLDRNNNSMTPLTELLLYEASRAQLVAEKIHPLLNKNGVIIADRFFDSTTAYQGYGRSISLQKIESLNSLICKNTIPDRTYILNISWEESLKRRSSISSRIDRMENQNQDFFEKIKKGFSDLAQQQPQRIVLLNGEQPRKNLKKTILQDALQIIENKMSKRV
ncbi:MAG: dTMP kinase [bacterium]